MPRSRFKTIFHYLDEIDPEEGVDAPDFLISATADRLNELGGRNWVPLIVRETGEDSYQVIGNTFIYAVAETAGLEKVWCIIAEPDEEAAELTQILAREKTPKINLSTTDREEIKSALQYLINQPGSPLKGVPLAVATNRIDEAPRQYWKNLEPIAKLGCKITRGKKLNALKELFYLTPQPLPEVIKDPSLLKTLTVSELKKMAKKRGIEGYGKKKKAELIELLSH